MGAKSMEKDKLIEFIREKFTGKILSTSLTFNMPLFEVDSQNLFFILERLKNDEVLLFNYLISLSGVDLGSKRGVVYHLRSTQSLLMVQIKSYADSQNAVFPSVVKLWPCAGWYERETYDMFGIKFNGHPDLRRLLLPDGWEGYPLLKDYVFPQSFSGIEHRIIESSIHGKAV